jgi:hypothetical protein
MLFGIIKFPYGYRLLKFPIGTNFFLEPTPKIDKHQYWDNNIYKNYKQYLKHFNNRNVFIDLKKQIIIIDYIILVEKFKIIFLIKKLKMPIFTFKFLVILNFKITRSIGK